MCHSDYTHKKKTLDKMTLAAIVIAFLISISLSSYITFKVHDFFHYLKPQISVQTDPRGGQINRSQ